MDSDSRVEALVTILDYSLKDRLNSTLQACQMPVAFLVYGLGTAKSAVYDILGYGGPKKIIAITLQTSRMALNFIQKLGQSIDFSKPGTGTCCSISLTGISNVVSEILGQADHNLEIGSEVMPTSSEHKIHLIVTIVNSGFFEQAMEAAKAAGATGGTVIHARGLGSKEAIKYLGITIEPEKDLILIVAPQEKKRAIMESITKAAGLTTPGNGICFSLPINHLSGFGAGIDNIDQI